MRLNV